MHNLSFILIIYLLSRVFAYPYYIIFSYEPGVEYDIQVNQTFISVISNSHTALHQHLPINCDGNQIKAKKSNGNIILEFDCIGKPANKLTYMY